MSSPASEHVTQRYVAIGASGGDGLQDIQELLGALPRPVAAVVMSGSLAFALIAAVLLLVGASVVVDLPLLVFVFAAFQVRGLLLIAARVRLPSAPAAAFGCMARAATSFLAPGTTATRGVARVTLVALVVLGVRVRLL